MRSGTSGTRRIRTLLTLMLPLALMTLRPPECAGGQAPPAVASTSGGGASLGTPLIPAAAKARRVWISLEEHRLHVTDGDRLLWSAEIGTGTGEQLEGAGQRWDFSTPPGEYMIQYKEKDPVWVLPDWVFLERSEPIPPWDAPERWVRGELGDAALYLTHEIAIHGTDHPELLGGAVSHGCIRMSNEDVLRLYDELAVGTPVIIH